MKESIPLLAALAVLCVPVLAALHALGPAEQSMLDRQLRSPAYAVSDPIAATAADPIPPGGTATASTVTTPQPLDGPAAVAVSAERGTAIQVTPTVPAPVGLPAPVDGDCESWRPLLNLYGIPYDEARPRMVRESQCSNAVNLNSSTGDASYGPLQVNRFGSLGAWWDSGGYTLAVMATPAGAVAAAAVLYHSCGWAPWTAPYGCDGDYLQTPVPEWIS